jgi:hypothetical protein
MGDECAGIDSVIKKRIDRQPTPTNNLFILIPHFHKISSINGLMNFLTHKHNEFALYPSVWKPYGLEAGAEP